MTSSVLIFTPKFELDAKQNLQDFIVFAQKLPRLNQEMDYESPYWKKAVNFTKVGISSQNKNLENLLDESIMPFAKAYFLYSQIMSPAKAFNEMKALRAIEKVMMKTSMKVDILNINSAILDQAAQVIRESYSAQAAYHGGAHLQKLHKFLVEKKIIKAFTWLNPIKRGEDTVDKVGKRGTENRNKKLPDEDALQSLAEIFSFGEENLSGRDILITSVIAILLSAPARASEVFYLKADCLHEDIDKDGNNALGIKWFSGKGYGFEVEWVPSVMENTVREAVRRLQNLSKPARAFALTLEQQRTLYGDIQNLNGSPFVPYKNGGGLVEVKWSEALISLFQNQLHLTKKTNPSKLWMPNINTLNEDLAPTKKLKKNSTELSDTKSIFERHNYPAYELKTHQIRHLLSTIAKVNGMDTDLLTKWSGRADKKQTPIYNQTEPEHYNKQLETIQNGNKLTTRNIPAVEVFDPKSIQEFNTNASLTLLQTEFGVCGASYISSPCTKHRNCITCSEQICTKGDDVKLERLKKRVELEQRLLASDKAAMDEGAIGADRHYNKRLDTIKIGLDLIDKLSDDNFPDGTLFTVRSELEMSQLDKAMDINHQKRLPKIENTQNHGINTLNNVPNSLAKLQLLKGK